MRNKIINYMQNSLGTPKAEAEAMFRFYTDTVSGLLQRLLQACSLQDFSSATAIANSLSICSKNIGADSMADLAEQLRIASEAEDPEQLQRIADKCAAEFAKLK